MERKAPGITVADLVPFDEVPQYLRVRTIAAGKVLRFAPPTFLGDEDCLEKFSDSIITSLDVEQPELAINEIYEATPLPATNMILHEGVVGHHTYFDAEHDVCMAERFGLMLVDPSARKIAFKPKYHPIRFSRALSLHGQCAGNYAHFLTEVLPRLLVADEYGVDPEAPILLDDGWLPANHIKLVRLFNRHGRNIVRVGRDQAANVYHLTDVAPTAYAPPEYRWFVEGGEMETTPPEMYRINRAALDLVRNFKLTKRAPKSQHGAKLFLGRKVTEFSTGRDLVNMHHLAHMAYERGFQAVNTGEMTALEQIAAFRDARVVIAPIGASLANLIFTPPGCHVVCLSPIYDKANYYYFAKLMAVLGHHLTYIIGPQVEGGPSSHPFHKNYSIDPEDLEQVLSDFTSTLGRWARLGFLRR